LLRLIKKIRFGNSARYWERRYKKGRNSGAGSYGRLAEFKANVLNSFIAENSVASAIEFRCGDGNQLGLINYPQYIGIDISATAIGICKQKYSGLRDKNFYEVKNYDGDKADVSLSLDVIFHLIEDDVFQSYMRNLFDAALRFVIIYSTNDESLNKGSTALHIKHRKFTDWIEANKADWHLSTTVKNPFPRLDNGEPPFPDFFIYEKS